MVMALGLSGTSLRNTQWVSGGWPVSNDARVGEQTGKPATALINRTLSDARRSKFGVLMLGSPANPNACARHWSASTTRMFGLRSAARAGFDSTAKIRNRMRTSLHEPSRLRVADPRSGPRLCEAQRFMVPMRAQKRMEALHEPYSQVIGNEQNNRDRFMASIHVRILEVFPPHEPAIGARTAMSARIKSEALADKAVRAPVRRWFHGPDA